MSSPFLDSELFRDEAEPLMQERLAALQAESAFQQEVKGANDMDGVARPLAVPFRWICRLDIEYDVTPFGSDRHLTASGRGTGTLISPCHVLTAAHNLTEYDPARRNTVRATRIRVTPAHDGSASPPVATVEADLAHSPVHPRWDIRRRHDATGGADNAGEVETNRYDYALLTLRSPIGDSRVAALGGPLGYWGAAGSGGAARFERLAPAVLTGHPIFVAGYGSDDCVRAARTARNNLAIPLNSQLTAPGRVQLVLEGPAGRQYVGRSMTHDADTCGGQSGAPVALELDGVFYLVGMHTAGVGLTAGGRANHAVRVTAEVSTQVNDWMAGRPCARAAQETEPLVVSEEETEPLVVSEEDVAPDAPDRAGEDEDELEAALDEPAGWAMEWAEAESTDVTEEHDTPPLTPAISDAVENKDWPRVLELAIQIGWHDQTQLTNLLFYTRHPELDRRRLDPAKNPKDRPLATEWNRILAAEVRPVVERIAEDRALEVPGRLVAERDFDFAGETGRKFRDLVARAAGETGLDPGFLAAVLLAEVGRASTYLRTGEVSSFHTGTDDFFAQRAQLRANVPAFTQVRFDATRATTNINEHGRQVTSIPYATGRDAALATAVYLKWGEIKLSRAARRNGGDFEALPVATRFVLVRVAMAAGHGGISPDGDPIRFVRKAGKLVPAKADEPGGILLGVAGSLQRVLQGEDILIRNWEPRKDPTNDGHVTHRNATILASQAIHLGDWFFRAAALDVQPEVTRLGAEAPRDDR
jgi:hypothetical protein